MELIPDDRPPTRKQEQFIAKLVKDFLDSKMLYEYEDYLKKPTKVNTSAFITLALESNWDAFHESEQYLKYIAIRPRAESIGSNGLFSDSDSVSLEEAMAELESYTGKVWTYIIRYDTAKGYEGIIEHHIIPAIGAIKLKQLSSIHIQRMYNDLKENGRMQRGSKQNDKTLSNTFVRRVHAVLQAALKQAVKERLIPYNPCENCRIPPKDKKEMTILPPEKIGRYL